VDRAKTTGTGCDEPEIVAPVIDRERCEAKAACVRVCPYDVFEVRRLGPAEKAALSRIGRVKALLHRNRQAFATRAERCHGCGLCVAACPEKAIELRPLPQSDGGELP
jgi:NAD-dependent dihydropyrimidine dehydrogenase PreA subunit